MSRAKIFNTRGFILLPILAALTLIGLFAYMLNRSGGIESRIADSLSTAVRSRYIAEAAMRHAKWFLAADCTYRAALANIPFGAGHSYGTFMTDNTDGTIHMVATGVFNGQNPDPTTHFTEIMVDDYRCVEQNPMMVYWSDGGDTAIRRAALDGSGVTNLLTSANGLIDPMPIGIDSANRKVYWGDNNFIYRSDNDGGFMQQVVDCVSCAVSGIDVDPANNVFYYTDQANDLVSRAELNGNNNTVLISSGISQPSSIRVDLANGRFYFADEGNSRIRSALLDATDVRTVKTGVRVTALALDPETGQIYYFDRNSRNIDRIDYNGGGLTTIMTFGWGTDINGLDLDLSKGLVYWTRNDDKRLQRAKLDGTDLNDFVFSGGSSTPWDVRLGPSLPTIHPITKGPYWTEDQGGNKKVVRRAELDGTNIQTLVAAQPTARNIKFDLLSERLYWAGNNKIMSSTAKGTGLTVVLDCNIAACSSVYGLALDQVNQHIYFVDQSDKKIFRVDYAGTNLTTLVSSLGTPWDIDLDLARGKMYWVDAGTRSLRRANLNGSSRTTVLSSGGGNPVRQPYAIAVDSSNSYLYWFDNDTRTIYRSTLSGGSVTTLIGSAHVNRARALALDLDSGKIYWAENSSKKIKRANLNGTSPEVVTDLTVESNKAPWGIVVVPAPQ